MPRERKSFLLRVDPRIHDALRRWSDDEFRSLNAQVEMLLRRALLEAGRLREEPEKDPGMESPPSAPADPSAPDEDAPGSGLSF